MGHFGSTCQSKNVHLRAKVAGGPCTSCLLTNVVLSGGSGSMRANTAVSTICNNMGVGDRSIVPSVHCGGSSLFLSKLSLSLCKACGSMGAFGISAVTHHCG